MNALIHADLVSDYLARLRTASGGAPAADHITVFRGRPRSEVSH